MKVKELMTRCVRNCLVDDTLNGAAQLMWEGDCGSVPVLGLQGNLLGIITDRDICMAAYTKGSSFSALRVRDAMAKVVWTCAPDATLEAAMSTMKEKRVRRLPVIDGGGQLVGILSLNDLAREARRQAKGLGGKEICAQLADTFGFICEGHDSSSSTPPIQAERAGELIGASS